MWVRLGRGVLLAVVASVAPVLVAGCTTSSGVTSGVVDVVAAENFYGDVVEQIGGPYVHVSNVLDNPNTDPHTFESSPRIAQEVAAARLVVQNGLGYDGFMNKIESAASGNRTIVVAQHVLGLPDDTPNPHLWYSPGTMPKVAAAVAADLASILPGHAASFRAGLEKFDRSLGPWIDAVAAFKTAHGGVPVATTEPVADYLLTAMGAENLSPFRFQADVMNGVDPAPQDISLVNGFFSGHQVKVFCYNEQVVDALTTSIRRNAESAGVPVVAVYETMPAGFTYQRWMLAEVQAIDAAVSTGRSTEHL